MTTQPTDEGKPLDENLTNTTTEQADFVEDKDPMIAEMEAAEAEIAAGAQAATGATGTETETVTEQPAAAAAAPKDKGPTPMVPKARLDEVLSERDLYRDQVGYLKGLNDARKSAPATATAPETAAAGPATGQPPAKPADQGAAKVDEVEAAISVLEEKKLAIAEKYDNGEISNKQQVQEQNAIDKEIRALSNTRIEKIREESRNEAQAAVQTNNFETVKNNVGLQLQAKHQNVAVIDALPPNMRDGIWKDITTDAMANLTAKGIDVKNATPQVKLMLIQEKARLTDDLSKYGLTGKQAAPAAANGGQPAPAKPSEIALQRKAKIELANSQPPSTTDMASGADNAEITDDQIANMNEDQIADLIMKAPQRVQRLLDGSQNRG